MYCPNCGKELPEDSRFCPSCGKETAPTPAKSAPTVTLNTKALLIVAAAVIVVLLAVLILRPGQSAGQLQNGPTQGQEAQTPAPTPTPDPAAALVGTWTNKDGVGLRFTSDGILKLSGFGLTLGGDTFTYEVTGANTLTLTATVGGVLSADMVTPYGIVDGTLYIQIGDYSFELTKE